jgi:hypothetical protein
MVMRRDPPRAQQQPFSEWRAEERAFAVREADTPGDVAGCLQAWRSRIWMAALVTTARLSSLPQHAVDVLG